MKLLFCLSLHILHLIWHFCKSSDKRKGERIQERALSRAICRSHSDTYEELLERANRPTLYNRLQDIVVLMYKVKYGSIRYIGPILWSKLNKDSYQKLLASLASFRNKIRKLNFSEYISLVSLGLILWHLNKGSYPISSYLVCLTRFFTSLMT